MTKGGFILAVTVNLLLSTTPFCLLPLVLVLILASGACQPDCFITLLELSKPRYGAKFVVSLRMVTAIMIAEQDTAYFWCIFLIVFKIFWWYKIKNAGSSDLFSRRFLFDTHLEKSSG